MGSRLAVLQRALVLSLLGGIFAQPATAQDQTLNGWFSITVADDPSDSGRAAEITYRLTDDNGRHAELLLDVAQMKPLGGPVAVNRKRVTVVGQYAEPVPDATAPFRVRSIALAPAETFKVRALSKTTAIGPQAWVTILCRFADATGITPYPVSFYERMMGSSYPGLGHYWREVSYGKLTNLTGSRVVGWYNLPQPKSYYASARSSPRVEAGRYDYVQAAEDCTAVADRDVFFPDFDGFHVIFNQDFDPPTDNRARGGNQFMTLDGIRRFWGVTWITPEFQPHQHVWAHEMGHAFGLQHSSGPYGQDKPLQSDTTYDSHWDVMSGWPTALFSHPEYGDVALYTIAYHKDFLGWIPPDRKYVTAPNRTQTITLARLAQPTSEGYLMAQIPIGESLTDFYTVEARRFAGYDETIPAEAVVIHKVDTTLKDRLAQVVDVDNNGDPNDAGAMWTVGEIFTDAENALQISIDAASASGYRVTINTNPDTFRTCIDFLPAVRHVFGPARDEARVQVEAPSDCGWSAISNADWLYVTSGGRSTGPGLVRYAVVANPGPHARTGTLTIGGWSFTVTQASTHNLLFADDIEGGMEGWRGVSSWARTTASARSGTQAWTDSPGGHYQNDRNMNALSPVINLTAVPTATLTFWHRHAFGKGDKGNVWVSRSGGREGKKGWWSEGAPLRTFSGMQPTWQQVSLDLTPFVGEQIRLTFQMVSDASETADGWTIDDIVVFSPDSAAADVCTHAVSPLSQIFGPHGGNASVEVSAPRGCYWRASSESSWLRITSEGSGSGPGQVGYAFTANPRSTARTGTRTVGGRTVRVTQARVKEVLFEDDMESGTEGWSGAPSWTWTTASAHSGVQAWTWHYEGKSNTSLWSPVIDLTQVSAAILTFRHRFNFTGAGQSRVWVAPQNGQKGREIKKFSSTQDWTQAALDLSPFAGQSIKIAFNVFGATNTIDGWTVDDVFVFSPDSVTPEPTQAR